MLARPAFSLAPVVGRSVVVLALLLALVRSFLVRGVLLARSFLVLALLLATIARAQEIDVRAWSVRDGLAQPRVDAIRRDSNGYVWFATWDGVSRFDGRRFVNYGSREGLPNPLVWCVAEAPDGAIWLGTHGGGIARIASTGVAVAADPIGPTNPAPCVFDVAFDRDGRMWLVTDLGLYRGERDPSGVLRFERATDLAPSWFGRPLLDERGELRFVATDELVLCRGARVERVPIAHGSSEDLGELRAVAPRRAGGTWVAHQRSLHVLDAANDGSGAATCRPTGVELGPNVSVYDVCEDAAGRAWVATSRGLVRLDGAEPRWYASAQGLPDDWIRTVTPDASGALWVGTHQGGAALLFASGAERFTARSGLGDGHAVELVALDADRWLVASEVAGLFEIANGRVHAVPASDRPPFDRVQRNVVRDAAGDAWLGTEAGIFRVRGPTLELARAARVGDAEGLPISAKSVLGVDGAGRVLVATDDGRLFAREPRSARFEPTGIALAGDAVRHVAISASGTTWCSDGKCLWRSRDGALELVPPIAGADARIQPRFLRFDSRGRLWIGTRFSGAAFTADPDAAAPRFERLTTRDGLASDVVFAFAEDRKGAVFLGTGRGVQRWVDATRTLEPVDDGGGGEWVTDLEIDARGDLWIASASGVAHVVPGEPRQVEPPPRVRFTRCVVAGAEVEIPAAGTTTPPAIEVGARDSRLAFEYVAPDAARGERLRYQTRFEGSDEGWSEPTRERSIRYGRLDAGSYRFAVRCVDPATSLAGEPTVLQVEVVPPTWTRPWFLALVAASTAALAFAAHRARVRRELALERVRTQIAADLHDDLGAGLAQIAIASELARRAPPERAREVLTDVAQTARDLRGSMSDLVWAIDPQRATLADVASRMRQLANDALGSAGLAVDFRAPDDAALEHVRLAPAARRDLVLWFKEAATNAARHARASSVRVEITLNARDLRVVVEDDGVGFDPRTAGEGRGLANLERRARELGGRTTIDSSPGRGTRAVLEVVL